MKGVPPRKAQRTGSMAASWAGNQTADQDVDPKVDFDPLATAVPARPAPLFSAAIYLVAFVTGAIVMSFEMLGSRYLNPYFGSGIYTWASLISTVLAALCAGYFLGGYAADRYPSPTVLGATVLVGSLYILVLPAFSEPMMES